ncbi:hypothetical protein TanjilG_01095 [Lupinus angustifolius]|uniref:ZCF37 n=1 Tax=Lupinus angustifolius TaxID=3871 RepID=A0A1J7HSC2_LUPAN|nr:PREDICTED: uncharacterized protein LOC109343219 [Lupinus angustifolius]OIW15572.1 hypothetical protein TanjilG_01095 [Lupinus angustifolius]
MLKPFLVCGTFHHEDDNPLLVSPGCSPRKSKRKVDNNPYSTRGLDKFSELLADLDEKRQKIYSQMNPQDISFIRFVYSKTDDFVPIVVKVRNKDDKKQHKSEELRVVKARNLTPISESMVEKSGTESNAINVEERREQPKFEFEAKESKKSFIWSVKKWDMWKPSFYVPMVMILILMFLTMFGRSFATICTCVLWYIIPTLKDNNTLSSNPRKSMKKKDYVRGLSEIKKVVLTNERSTQKKKDYVRGYSEKKMVVNEGMKKKEHIRRWSEKKIETEGLVSLKSDHNPEASKDYKSSTPKHGHKKSW